MIERLSRIIAHYDAEGVHRTATAVDQASAEWLADELKSAGATALIEPFATERVDVIAAALLVDDLRIDGVPAFDCTYTGAQGITGTLGDIGSSPDIGIAVAPPPLMLRLVNAEHFTSPFGPPVLQVSNRHWPVLQQALGGKQPARIIADARRTRTTAANVGAEIWGSKMNLAPLVIMTPRSGSWHCAHSPLNCAGIMRWW